MMISSRVRTGIYLLLVFVVIKDIVLSVTTIFFPEVWYKFFHDAPYVDPQGLLRRTGAVWAAFTLLQVLALFRWQQKPWWLVLIAGVRLTELFSDWTYIYVAQSTTTLGGIGLFLAPPFNLAAGCFLVWAYLKIRREGSGSI